MLKYIASLILLTVLSCPAFGQGEVPISIDPTRAPTTTQSDQSFKKDYNPSFSDIELNLSLYSSYKAYLPNYWSNVGNQPEVLYEIEYEGMQGLIRKHAIRALNRFYSRAEKNTWENSYLSDYELRRAQHEHAMRKYDSLHPWWTRKYFFDSFPVAKGGSHVEHVTIGKTYDIFSLGPLKLTTAGKISWSDWDFFVTSDKDFSSRGLQRERKNLDNDVLYEEVSENPRHYSFGIAFPDGNLALGNHWSVSGSLKIGLKLDAIESSISGSIKFRYRPWVAMVIKAEVRPFIQEYKAEISIALFRF